MPSSDNGPGSIPPTRPPFHGEPPGKRSFDVVNACIVAIMLAVAVGAMAVECGFYKAFDDNLFDLGRSALPSLLAMLGAKDAR
ncbi:hypothetical protein [Variovorax sp. DAIF25]|uniref:hypothetical protein n=1 Tax=Variovorax sp. DAIF25 TaxID=3080983 RepID=UPI003D6C08D5